MYNFNKYKQIIKLFERYIEIYDEYIDLLAFINNEKDNFYFEIDKKFQIRGTEYLSQHFNNNEDFKNFLHIYLEEITKDLPYEINFKQKYQRWIYLDDRLNLLINEITTHEAFEETDKDIDIDGIKQILNYYKLKLIKYNYRKTIN